MYLVANFDKGNLLAPAVAALLELPPGFHHRSRASLLAVLGAVINGGLATAFMFYTQQDYPIVTGGMPLRSWWATGVITYELTMAGAVAGLTVALIWEAGLLRRRKPPAPPLDNNAVSLRVLCSPGRAAVASECLLRRGATNVCNLEEQP
jgi:hypothetical protein